VWRAGVAMAKATASCSIRSPALAHTLGGAAREFARRYEDWQATWRGFRANVPDPDRSRLDELGSTLWRFDLRYRWAVGVTALEFDDAVVTKATTAATRQGYFLLMRLVDVWFSLDLAFDLYASTCVPSHVRQPSLVATLERDTGRRLRAIRAVAAAVHQDLRGRLRKPGARARLSAWMGDLAERADPRATTARLSAVAAREVAARRALGPQHLGSVACLVRNAYIHGGETASSRGLPAQEKVPVLRHLVGFTAVTALSLGEAAAAEMCKQPARLVRLGGGEGGERATDDPGSARRTAPPA
jgi:hypothetical protein